MWDPNEKERRNVTTLLRWIGAFVAWPALSIGLIFMLDWDEHALHIVGLIPVGLAGLAVAIKARAIAGRFYPTPTDT